MANPTMTLIASNTVGSGGVSSVTFSSIPQTGYTDLKIVSSTRFSSGPGNGTVYMYFNADTTASNYTTERLLGDGSSASSGSYNSPNTFYTNLSSTTANTFTSSDIYIPNYTSSTVKSFSVDSAQENMSSSGLLNITAGIWSGTAAITSVQITSYTTDIFAQYSTFYLYGIKNS